MARLLIWSRRASEDLAEIAAYIAQDSEVYSTSVVRTILKKARMLSEFPMIGRIVPEFGNPSLREIFAYSYRIIYKVASAQVSIAAIVHGKRNLDLSLKP